MAKAKGKSTGKKAKGKSTGTKAKSARRVKKAVSSLPARGKVRGGTELALRTQTLMSSYNRSTQLAANVQQKLAGAAISRIC